MKIWPPDTMSNERYQELMDNPNLWLTAEEIEAGWHFCCEWDYLLIHPSHPEAECCTCHEERPASG